MSSPGLAKEFNQFPLDSWLNSEGFGKEINWFLISQGLGKDLNCFSIDAQFIS